MTLLLSILIPHHDDDPRALVDALGAQARRLDRDIEIVVHDDASPDPAAHEALRTLAGERAWLRATRSERNEGRGGARNRLRGAARGRWLLFLDADMMPADDGFLARWVAEAEAGTAVAFGGFVVPPACDPARRLHWQVSRAGDCADAAARAHRPAEATTTANLLVRRDVLDAIGFDDGFTGYGFEDTDWALRVQARYPIRHIDNPAVHLGLETDAVLIRKARESAVNWARLVRRHPEAARAWPSMRAARLLARLPGRGHLAWMAERTARARALPDGLRARAFRLWRATCFAAVLR